MSASMNAEFVLLHVANVALGLAMVVPICAVAGAVLADLLHRRRA